MAIHLVCEGPADGLDVRVLNLIIAQKLGRPVQVTPTGGESSLRSVRTWLEERSRTELPNGTRSDPHDRAYAIEDRNFRPAAQIEDLWQQPDQKRWIWRRHEIENYLLDPRLVAHAFQEIKKAPIAQKFADQLPDNGEKALNLLQQLAHVMLENYVGQLLCQQLSFYKGDTTNTNLSCPLRLAGSPYASRADWLNYLQIECERMKEACRLVNGDTQFDLPGIEADYDHLLAEVNKPEFLREQFLIDMGGYELMDALLYHVKQNIGVARLTYAVFTDELIKALDALYQPGFFVPDDFSELADRLSDV